MSARRVSALTAVVSAAVVAVSVVAAPAGAVPSTKYYTASASPTWLYASSTPSTVTFTLANCSGSTCAQGSTQSWGSAHVILPAAWNWGYTATPTTVSNLQVYSANGLPSSKTSHWSVSTVVTDPSTGNTIVELGNDGTNSAYAVAAGESLTFTASLTPSPTGLAAIATEVKQSNNFSGTGNDFLHAAGNTDPIIRIGAGPPAKIVYGQAPSDVQVSSSSATHYMCPPVTAVIEDAHDNVVDWLPPTAVTLSSTGAPGLKLNGSSTLSANTSNGVATFGTGDATSGCTAGLAASAQGTFDLTASTTVAAGAGYAGGTFSTPASTYSVYLQLCVGNCNVGISGNQTNAGINATGTGTNPLIGFISAAGTLPTGCDAAHISYRPEATTLFLDGHDKSVDLSWSKKVTNLDPRNGTPFWPVCIVAPYNVYVTNSAGQAVTADATNGAMLALCSTPGVVNRPDGKPSLPCISSLYKNAASEHAVVWLPNVPGDPHLF